MGVWIVIASLHVYQHNLNLIDGYRKMICAKGKFYPYTCHSRLWNEIRSCQRWCRSLYGSLPLTNLLGGKTIHPESARRNTEINYSIITLLDNNRIGDSRWAFRLIIRVQKHCGLFI